MGVGLSAPGVQASPADGLESPEREQGRGSVTGGSQYPLTLHPATPTTTTLLSYPRSLDNPFRTTPLGLGSGERKHVTSIRNVKLQWYPRRPRFQGSPIPAQHFSGSDQRHGNHTRAIRNVRVQSHPRERRRSERRGNYHWCVCRSTGGTARDSPQGAMKNCGRSPTSSTYNRAGCIFPGTTCCLSIDHSPLVGLRRQCTGSMSVVPRSLPLRNVAFPFV